MLVRAALQYKSKLMLFGALFCLASSQARADSVLTFASFFTSSSNPLYTFTNHDDGTGTFISNSNSSIYFLFTPGAIPVADQILTLPTTPIAGTLIRTSNTSTVAVCTPTCTGSNPVTQELGTGSVVFLDSNNKVLLGITGSDLFINGTLGGSAASFVGSSASSSIAFYSDYINFSTATVEDRSISLNAITPSLSIGPGGLLNSFTAQASGNFGVSFTPEPGSGVLLLLGCAGLIARRRGRMQANANPDRRNAPGSGPAACSD
jgi:hypothetical protein